MSTLLGCCRGNNVNLGCLTFEKTGYHQSPSGGGRRKTELQKNKSQTKNKNKNKNKKEAKILARSSAFGSGSWICRPSSSKNVAAQYSIPSDSSHIDFPVVVGRTSDTCAPGLCFLHTSNHQDTAARTRLVAQHTSTVSCSSPPHNVFPATARTGALHLRS